MSDDLQTDGEAFLRELDELDSPGEGVFQGTVGDDKDEVIGLLASLGAACLLVEYDGSGDQGSIDLVICRGPDEAVIELSAHAREAVEDFVYESLPDGWEIDGGGYGAVEFDITSRTVRFLHAQRVVEIFESEWGG